MKLFFGVCIAITVLLVTLRIGEYSFKPADKAVAVEAPATSGVDPMLVTANPEDFEADATFIVVGAETITSGLDRVIVQRTQSELYPASTRFTAWLVPDYVERDGKLSLEPRVVKIGERVSLQVVRHAFSDNVQGARILLVK